MVNYLSPNLDLSKSEDGSLCRNKSKIKYVSKPLSKLIPENIPFYVKIEKMNGSFYFMHAKRTVLKIFQI